MRFDAPLAFLILLVIPVLIAWRRRGRSASVRFPSAAHAARSGRSWRERLASLPLVLRVAALVLLAVALARPQQGTERVRQTSKGIAIMMILDRSSSMNSEFDYRGERSTRIDTCKRVFQEFVLGNHRDLPGRPDDLVGMVAFARYADTICPLTLGHGVLVRFLEQTHIVRRREEDRTSIGDAIALAAARLKNAEADLAREAPGDGASYEIKSKVIILLTDGENNYGQRTPEEAAELAKAWGIRIYAIGVGGESVTTVQTPFGPRLVRTGEGEADISTLKAIAEKTGGIARMANDAESLHAVYKEIDRLEKSEVESVRFLDYREMFTPFALAALALLLAEAVLASTLFRRIP